MSHLQLHWIQIPSPCLSMACGVTDINYGAHDETAHLQLRHCNLSLRRWRKWDANRLTAISVSAYNS